LLPFLQLKYILYYTKHTLFIYIFCKVDIKTGWRGGVVILYNIYCVWFSGLGTSCLALRYKMYQTLQSPESASKHDTFQQNSIKIQITVRMKNGQCTQIFIHYSMNYRNLKNKKQ